MRKEIEIREGLATDISELEQLYPDAFPDEDLLPLVRNLLQEKQGVLSLVAVLNGEIAGHVVFTTCGVAGNEVHVALLGPLGVASAAQKQGVGSALVHEGLQQLRDQQILQVLVLGDPAYYGRFGFETETRVSPPYPLPKEWLTAWQSMSLREDALALEGALHVPEPWRHPALWSE